MRASRAVPRAAAAILAAVFPLLAAFEWVDVEPMPPSIFHGASPAWGVLHGRDIHLAGGMSGLAEYDAHSAYDAQLDQWVSLRALPEALLFPTGVVVSDEFFVLGGGNFGLPGFLNQDMYRYDEGADAWQITPWQPPVPAVGMRAAILNGEVHALGGSDYLQDVYTAAHRVFTPGTGWITLTDMPAAVALGGLASDGQRLFYAGGFVDDALTPSPKLYIYDPSTGWSEGPDLPAPRGDLNAAFLQGKIVMAGGWDGQSTTFDRVDLFDPVTGQWEDGPPLGCPREGPAVDVASDGSDTRLYALSGTQGGWALAVDCAEASVEDITPPVFAGLESAAETTLCPAGFVPSVTLDWQPGVDAQSPPVTYVVYRSADPGFTPSPADILVQGLTDADVPWTDFAVTCSESWTYIVQARDDRGNESDNAAQRITVDVLCTPPPPPPPISRELRVAMSASRQDVNLTWAGFAAPPEVTHYHVYRSADPSLPHAAWDRLLPDPTAPAFTDTDPSGALLFYDVRTAIDCQNLESVE